MIQILKPNRDNLNTSLSIGLPLIVLGFIDFFGNTFLNTNITEFLPSTLSYFFPLIVIFFQFDALSRGFPVKFNLSIFGSSTGSISLGNFLGLLFSS